MHFDPRPAFLVIATSLLWGACQDRPNSPSLLTETGDELVEVDANVLEVLRWRPIGPWRGGKSIAVGGHPSETGLFYMGSTNGGGVWKTDDAGVSWDNLSDGFFTTTTVSALAISESDPNVVVVGTGDVSFRTNISRGDGVYRSEDGGQSWQNMGLAETRNISHIKIHPDNPDLVYVASHGHGFIPDPNRGIYRSRDGGESWEHILYVGDEYGVIALAMDQSRPNTLYAASWNGRRFPWTIRDAGPQNGVWKSTDGGDTWSNISDAAGLPSGLKGRISLDISQSDPDRIWALMTAEGDGTDGLYRADAPGQANWKPCRDYYCSGNGLYRSDDGGATWERVSNDPNFFQRPWYYTHVVADPTDPDVVYVLNTSIWKSTDGGRTFTALTTLPHGDHHALWIDPEDPRRMIGGGDGGATVTLNGGRTWSSVENQPTGQMYNASVDNDFPYNVCAPQQDNTSICVPSRSDEGRIFDYQRWTTAAAENGGIAIHPDDPELSYGGDHHWIARVNRRTGERRWISPWPEHYYGTGEDQLRYRQVWDVKVFLSPHDPRVLYTATQFVHRSTDEGESWDDISPDLTIADTTKFEPTPPSDRGEYWGLTRENVGIEWYAAIASVVESPVREGVLWTGSNDGLVYLTRDGGANWENVTPPDLEPDTWVSVVEPSRHDPAAAYVVGNRHMLGDDAPYVWRTGDYGNNWQRIDGDFPADDFVWVVREDTERRGLLFAGAEWSGVWTSLDDGGTWHSMRLNLPVTPVRDLKVKDGDLVAATHGRAHWIADDITPLRQLAAQDVAISDGPSATRVRGSVHLFTPRPTIRFREMVTQATFGGLSMPNPPNGVVLRYYLPNEVVGEVQLAIHDSHGEEIRTFSSAAEAPGPGPDPIDPADLTEPDLPASVGANIFEWDMRYPEPIDWVPKTLYRHRDPYGPLAPPGRYEVRLTVAGHTHVAPFEIIKDPRVSTPQADFNEQFTFLMEIRSKIGEAHRAVERIHNLRRRTIAAIGAAAGTPDESTIAETGADLDAQLWAIEDQIRQFRVSRDHRAKQELINWPVRLDDKFAKLLEHSEASDAVPTTRDRMLFDDLAQRLDEQLDALGTLEEGDASQFFSRAETIK
jgi:photosystem II stability/assembly factor-like uncharacterized protein